MLHSRPFFLSAVNVPNYRDRTRMEQITKHIPRADAKWLGQQAVDAVRGTDPRRLPRRRAIRTTTSSVYTQTMRQRIAALERAVKLIIEPDDGVAPLLAAIKRAKKSVEIAIFRFDRKDIEMALKAAAAAKGVRVTALIAFANRGGEQSLRKLESALPRRRHHRGAQCQRPDPLSRQVHPDRSPRPVRAVVQLHASRHRPQPRLRHRDDQPELDPRSRPAVQGRLHADAVRAARRRTRSSSARRTPGRCSATFLKGAKTQLLIYDPKISDKEMLRILQERAKAGVEIKVIGSVAGRAGSTCRNWPARGCTRARSSATGARPSSAARAFARRNWTRAAKWASSFGMRRS